MSIHNTFTLDQYIDIFTNGGCDKPYLKHVDNDIIVLIADDQVLCRIPPFDGMELEFAQALCSIGEFLQNLKPIPPQ